MAGVDWELVRHALRVARQRGYAEVELSSGGWEFQASLEPGVKLSAPAPQEKAASPEDMLALKAPFVGYYKASDPPLKAGQSVKKGDVVGGILALGIPNDVEADAEGEIEEVLIKDGEPVEFGQPIATLRRPS
jgi:acetyl-CoA carboxylase biotin carboxyl carrier protein